MAELPNLSPQRWRSKVERIVNGGWGLCRTESGLVVFVPFVCEGETIEFVIDSARSNFAFGHVVSVSDRSPHRTEPRCSHFGVCGGCQFQHLTYSNQLQLKWEWLLEVLNHHSLLGPETVCEPIEASPEIWRYRKRLRVHSDQGHLGFFGRKSHQLFQLEDCPIAHESLMEFVHNPKGIDLMEKATWELEVGSEGTVDVRGPDDFRFCQVNSNMNTVLKNSITQWEELSGIEEIFDLFGGSGNLSDPFVTVEKKWIVDSLTQLNSSQSGRKAQVRQMDVSRFLGDLPSSSLRRLFIVDPPRGGCRFPVLKALNDQSPQRVLYVSCNAQTLARDLRELFNLNSKHRILRLKAFDMFPQTTHFETAVVIDLANE